jgi:hypothetical protein
VQDLLVTSVLAGPLALTVQVVDASGERNAITFHVDDPVRRGELLAQLRAWIADRHPVTYVRSRGGGALVDERRLLARARGDEEWA